jgi:streptogramin lyase
VLWTTYADVTHVGFQRISTNGDTAIFPSPLGGVAKQVNAVALAPNGDLWLATSEHDAVRMTSTGAFDVLQVPFGAIDLAAGSDGLMWYASGAPVIARINPDLTVTQFPTESGTRLTLGSDGNIWFITGSHIVRVTPAGVCTGFPLTLPAFQMMEARGVATGSDGALWISDPQDHLLVRFRPDGYRIGWQLFFNGTPLSPQELANGLNDDLWFSDTATDALHFWPIGDLTHFVQHLWQDLLDRDVDAAGLVFWTTLFEDGTWTDTAQLSGVLVTTAEYRQRVVIDIYRRYLRRDPDAAGLAYWAELVGQSATPESLTTLIIGSDEYFTDQASGDNEQYVTQVYTDLLERGPDPDGLKFWQRQLSNGVPRPAVAAALVYSDEAVRNLVRGLYERLLRRAPDAAGEDFWVLQIQHGLSDAGLVVSLTGSTEYFDREA